MKHVAKLVIIDPEDTYLLMHRSEHPTFGIDPDLPGGTLEAGELPLKTMLREVEEEAGVTVNPHEVEELYSGTDYSKHGTHYTLYAARVTARPEITMSWEHSTTAWGAVPVQDYSEDWWDLTIETINGKLMEKYKIPNNIQNFVEENIQTKDERHIAGLPS